VGEVGKQFCSWTVIRRTVFLFCGGLAQKLNFSLTMVVVVVADSETLRSSLVYKKIMVWCVLLEQFLDKQLDNMAGGNSSV
jgi:hypothetical protein